MMKSITWDTTAAAHLLSRTGFGGPPGAAVQLASRPLPDAVDLLLTKAVQSAPPPVPDWVKDPWVNTERVYPETTREQRSENHRTTRARYSVERDHLRTWWLDQMITTSAPLAEVMTLFWHGHFTTEARRSGLSQALYEQNVKQRRHAFGNFRELLRAMTLDAAMMQYLDMEGSEASSPNENYARELLELFTVGIGNYAERDIKEIARALTGWVCDAPPGTPKRPVPPDTSRTFSRDGLVPTFQPKLHDDGVKTVLGKTGRFGVDEVLDIVAAHPATARFISGKLIAFFEAADPHGEVRDRMAEAFAAHRGEITPVLRVLLTSPDFYANASRGNLIKSPVHLLVGSCRLLNLKVTPTPSLARVTAAMGQELFNPPNVKGWPGGRDWISAGTLAVRYHLPEALFDSKEPAGLEPLSFERNFALPADEKERKALINRIQSFHQKRLAERREGGLKVAFEPSRIFEGAIPTDPAELTNSLLRRLLVVSPRAVTRSAIVDTLKGIDPNIRPEIAARLILTTPEYQLA